MMQLKNVGLIEMLLNDTSSFICICFYLLIISVDLQST